MKNKIFKGFKQFINESKSLSKLPIKFNWKKDMDLIEKIPYYDGPAYTKCDPDDYIITNKKEIFKFKFGNEDTNKPYVEFIKYDSSIKLPKNTTIVEFKYNNDNWCKISSNITLYKLKDFDELYVWDY